MSITREHPDHVFTTTDGTIFRTAEEAHAHEREERLFTLAREYASRTKGVFSLVTALSALATEVAAIVRATPLAKG